MIKRDELTHPNSCMSRAKEDEMTFVLLARDAAGPATIRFWIGERLRRGKNKPDDPQIVEAEQCAARMEQQRASGEAPSSGHAPPPDVIAFLNDRLAAHEGGAGAVSIGWDDATRDYIISQKNLSSGNNETLGCSRYLRRAFELAISGEKYDGD